MAILVVNLPLVVLLALAVSAVASFAARTAAARRRWRVAAAFLLGLIVLFAAVIFFGLGGLAY